TSHTAEARGQDGLGSGQFRNAIHQEMTSHERASSPRSHDLERRHHPIRRQRRHGLRAHARPSLPPPGRRRQRGRPGRSAHAPGPPAPLARRARGVAAEPPERRHAADPGRGGDDVGRGDRRARPVARGSGVGHVREQVWLPARGRGHAPGGHPHRGGLRALLRPGRPAAGLGRPGDGRFRSGVLKTPPPPQLDRRLARKYDGPGPRYTSYPSAPAFRESFGPAEHAALLAASARRGAPLSLYVHVPFCATRCLFCGCNVVVSRDRGWGERYLPLLEREMELAAGELDAGHRQVVQVHWGGGTPTFLPPRDLTGLMASIRRHFRLASGCEISVEVDPREASPGHLDALAEAGVNRLSLGVQDLDPTVQRAIRRVQTAGQTRGIVEGARGRGIAGINVDLIYGLPYQTVPGFLATVREVLEMSPDRLAIYNFAFLPTRLRHQRALDPASLPGAEEKLSLLEEAIREIIAAGYVFIGMDHFA